MIESEHPWNIKKDGSGYEFHLEKTDPNNGKMEITTDFGDINIEKNWESYRQ